MCMNLTTTPLLRYPGGKYRARKIISKIVPDNTSRVLSPFAGGASVELFLTKNEIHVDCYDGYDLLANFWGRVLEDPMVLSDNIETHLGNVYKKDFLSMQKILKEHHNKDIKENDRLNLAVLFFIVNRCSFSGTTLSGGFSQESSTKRFTVSSIDRVKSFDNPFFTYKHGFYEDILENDDAVKGYDFLLLDPPYLLRNKEKDGVSALYGVSGDMHKYFDHENFRDVVIQHDIPFILTYNNVDEVKDMWSDYYIYPAQWSYGMNASKKSSEIIITNFEVDGDDLDK